MNSSRAILPLLVFIAVTGCKIAKEDPAISTKASIVGYFINQQSAISSSVPYDDDYSARDIWSLFFGRMYLSTPEASMDNVVSPEMKCQRAAQAEVRFKINNVMDPGTLTLIGSSGQLEIPKYEADYAFQLVGFLGFGPLKLRSSGNSGTLDFVQDLNVPSPGQALKVSSGAYNNQPVPSPNIDNASVIRIQRSAGAQISFTASAFAGPETHYIKVMLGDADNPDSDVTCFAPVQSPIQIPASATERFGISNRGFLRVDFVNASMRRDIPRVRQNLILSSSFHMHGTNFNQVLQEEFQFGELHFE